jgi:hypothetical protein
VGAIVDVVVAAMGRSYMNDHLVAVGSRARVLAVVQVGLGDLGQGIGPTGSDGFPLLTLPR